MLICCKCQREMRCDKIGVGADFGNGHVYPAVRFICKYCGHTILNTTRNYIVDPDHKSQSEYLFVKEGNT